jgi:hypothetical protein
MSIPGALTHSEKVARRLLMEDTRAALATGKSIDEYRSWRDKEVERWCEYLHAKMAELHADDPTEILPQLAMAIEERCVTEARKIAEATAKSVIALMLRKAIA